MSGDEGTYVEAQLLIMERNGYPEETYYTFSYSPIPTDDGTARRHHLRQHRRHPARDRRAPAHPAARAGDGDLGSPHLAAGLRARRPGAGDQSARPALRHDLHGRARQPDGFARQHDGDCQGSPGRRADPVAGLGRPLADRRGVAEPCAARRRRSCRDGSGPDAQRAPGTSRRAARSSCRSPRAARRAGRASSSRASTPSVCSTAAMPASSTWSPARSPRPSPTPRPTRRSAGAPRRWPRSTGPRRRSSPMSATSSARR